MEKVDVSAKVFLHKLSKEKNTFFKESAVYKKRFFISMKEYIELLYHVDSNGLFRI